MKGRMRTLISVFLSMFLFQICAAAASADTEDPATKIRTVGETVAFGSYEQDNDLNNGKEPIEWIVLDVQEQGSLLLSRSILEAKAFQDRGDDVEQLLRSKDNQEEISWDTCTLRKWLNSDFTREALKSTGSISLTDYPVDYEGTQKDKIFLLS